MRFYIRKRRQPPAIIIVALIDILIVLLIFLMVTTTFKKELPSLKLALPQARQAKAGAVDPKAFEVLVSTNFPFFYLGDKPVTYDKLQKEIAEAAKQNPQLKVMIKADKQSPYGEVIKVIDAARAANVGSIDAVTERAAAR